MKKYLSFVSFAKLRGTLPFKRGFPWIQSVSSVAGMHSGRPPEMSFECSQRSVRPSNSGGSEAGIEPLRFMWFQMICETRPEESEWSFTPGGRKEVPAEASSEPPRAFQRERTAARILVGGRATDAMMHWMFQSVD